MLERPKLLKMPRPTAQQVILGKEIKTLPIIGEGADLDTEMEARNGRLVLSSMPFAYDFICNMLRLYRMGIDGVKRHDVADPDTSHYYFNVDKETALSYFKTETMYNNFLRNMEYYRKTGLHFIKLYRKQDKEFYLQKTNPFEILTLPTNRFSMDLVLAKCVFAGLVEEYAHCLKNVGYIVIPANFMPSILCYENEIEKANIIYKTNITGLLKNTHRAKQITMQRNEFANAVFPEQVKSDGYLKENMFRKFQESINPTIEKIVAVYEGQISLVKGVYLGTNADKRTGRPEKPTVLYFTHKDLFNGNFKKDPLKFTGMFQGQPAE